MGFLYGNPPRPGTEVRLPRADGRHEVRGLQRQGGKLRLAVRGEEALVRRLRERGARGGGEPSETGELQEMRGVHREAGKLRSAVGLEQARAAEPFRKCRAISGPLWGFLDVSEHGVGLTDAIALAVSETAGDFAVCHKVSRRMALAMGGEFIQTPLSMIHS